jgi:asparagine synthase (glutamine-hydrolysing)
VCGICGLVGFSDQRATLERMLPFIKHRGPDNTGLWTGEGVGLGHTRLSIVDLSPAAKQPMPNEQNTVFLVANGEIYNSNELRPILRKQGHRFRSQSDNEVLLHLYEEEGEEFLPRINGMFAMAIWDVYRKRLILARDRLGIKPLYYCFRPEGLVFASEIKALLVCPKITSSIDPIGLMEYLTYENTFGSTTLHKNVQMVEPGQFIVYEAGSIRKGFFWRPDFDERLGPGFEDACHSYLGVAERSVRRHLMSDVEVASYLSSGFDSTTVSTLASQHVTGSLATYTGAFHQSGWYDETIGASSVAERIKSRHTTVEINAGDLEEVMDDLIFALDEPRMGMGSFSQYMVAKAAAKRVKVILTGHGGDELFAGYPVFKLLQLCHKLRDNPLGLFGVLRKIQLAEWPHLVYFLSQSLRGKTAGCFLPIIFSSGMLARGLRTEVYDQLKDIKPASKLQQIVASESDPYRRLALVYLRAYLPGLFVVEDKISMAHGLESRIPLCDNELLEFAFSLPLSLKLQSYQLKAVPKAAMRGLLPEVLYHMPKRGFPTPLSHWLRGELKGWMRERLLNSESCLHRLFRPDFIKRIVEDYLGSWRREFRPLDEIQTHRIWILLSLEAWLRVSEEHLGVRLELS